jgi:hypothetical protein
LTPSNRHNSSNKRDSILIVTLYLLISEKDLHPFFVVVGLQEDSEFFQFLVNPDEVGAVVRKDCCAMSSPRYKLA